MKLRQKLAAVLSASMVVAAVPVVTMADSTNTVSVYNYSIKNTTIGFQTTSTAIKADATTAAGLQIYTGVANGSSDNAFNANSVPAINVEPSSTYVIGGSAASPAQTVYLHLTEDSSFQEDALLFYAEALYNGGTTTGMYIDEKGIIIGANHPDLTGDTVDKKEALRKGVTVYMGKTDTSSRTLTDTGMVFRKVEVNEFTENDRKYTSTLRVDLFGTFEKDTVYRIPLLAKVGGDKEVLLKLDGRDSFLTSNTFTLTEKLTDKRISVSSDSNTITVDDIDEIGELRISESAINSLKKDGEANRQIKLTLPASSDLEFNITKTQANIKATGKRGFFGFDDWKNDKLNAQYGKGSRNSNELDRNTLIVELPDWSQATSKGEIVLTGIYVQPQDHKAAKGDVNLTVEEFIADGKKSENLVEKTVVKVAEVKDYEVTLKAKDDKVPTIKAGRSGVENDKEVTFVLEETVKDSLVDSRKIEFTLENGYIFGPADIDVKDNMTTYTANQYKEKALEKFQELIKNEKIKFKEKAEGIDLSSLTLEINKDGQVIGFAARYPKLTREKADKLEITIPVATDVQATGEVKLVANNLFTRTDIKDTSCVIANITSPIEVTVEAAQVKVGLQGQETGSITIKETEKGMLERGWLFLSADEQKGITFDKLPKIEVKDQSGKTIEIKNAALSKDKTVIGFEITRTSEEASTIEITDMAFTADRTVPEANYDLAIWGSALTDENQVAISNFNQNSLYSNKYFDQISDKYIVESFIQMTTKNTEDITSASKAVTTSFVIGEKTFEVNGEKVTMDSAAYIKDGLTFVPVRYLAQAFGFSGNALQYDKASSTATIIAGDKVISITNGKAFIVVNGTQVPMATKAEVKEGRMCVPMSYIAAALGVEKSWDAATKTATFTNIAK